MPVRGDDETRARKRVSNACQRCRKHKIKCSGNEPCETCDNRGLRCEFGSDDKKVVISESILQELKSRLNELEKQQQQPQRQDQPVDSSLPSTEDNETSVYEQFDDTGAEVTQPATPTALRRASARNVETMDPAAWHEETSDPEQAEVSNPLVPEQPAYMSDNSGRLYYLGHSSTWSFSRQILHMAHQSPHSNPPMEASLHVEGEAYKLGSAESNFSSSDIAGLPSMDLSMYYLQSVKFRTYPLFYLFCESNFTLHLHRFYESPTTYGQTSRLWYVHYLIIMALGKAFVAQTQAVNAPTGSELFVRALRLLPDVTSLCRDPVGSTEMLCCIALYLHSIDHRSAAHIYIGQAIRMAQSHGLHTDMQANAVGPDLVRRGRRVWWTVYTLDRKMSSSMGVPNSLHDEDVTTPLTTSMDSEINPTGQILHVKICQVLGKVVSTVYSRDGTLNKTFLTTARAVLRGIASLAGELALFSNSCFGEISRIAAHLNLAYHQCIILASRPFVFYLLKLRFESSDPSHTFPLSSSAKGLVQVCIDSAMQIVTILSALQRHELLDTFLPFDLESAFSAAFVLVMASSVHPKLLPQENWLNTIMAVFDYMIMKGNVLASLRKSEVEELAQMLRPRRQTHQNNISTAVPAAIDDIPATISVSDHASLPSLGDPFFDEWLADDGLSGAQIMDLVDALNAGGVDDFIS